jgi:hypothetical protein
MNLPLLHYHGKDSKIIKNQIAVPGKKRVIMGPVVRNQEKQERHNGGASWLPITGEGDNKMEEVTKETLIGDVIKHSPEAKAIIQKHFGSGCFSCPGVNMESIAFGSTMHNLDPQMIVDEINQVLKGEAEAAS